MPSDPTSADTTPHVPTIPKALLEAIDWVQNHAPVWAQPGVAEQIGLRAEGVAELEGLADEAADALAEYRRAEVELAALGQRYRLLARNMRTNASGQVAQIRGYARASGDPGAVYAAAKIRRPASRGTAPAPGTATSFTTRLLVDGGLEVAFRCPHPKGVEHVTYTVERRVGHDGAFEYLTTTGERRFVDDAVPVGAGRVTYMVRARTSTREGNPAVHQVRLGTVREGSDEAARAA